jgi:hypothetical protein
MFISAEGEVARGGRVGGGLCRRLWRGSDRGVGVVKRGTADVVQRGGRRREREEGYVYRVAGRGG